MPDVQVLHGPRLSPFKAPLGEKRRPCTWSITARLQAPMVDACETLARKFGCNRGDIIRTALTEFLAKHADALTEHTGNALTAHQSPREAQINLGLVPHTSQRDKPSQPHHRASDGQSRYSLPAQDQNAPETKTKREGMKDKIPSF